MNLLVFALLAFFVQTAHGASPSRKLEPDRTCPDGQQLCNHNPGKCYSPSAEQCLTFNDGSGGTLCPLGATFCGGKCLIPNAGKECVRREGNRAGGVYEEICDVGQRYCGSGCYTPTTHDCVDGFRICEKGQAICGNKCYTPSADAECIPGSTGDAVCKRGEKVCGSAICYSPKNKKCIENEQRIVDI